MDLFRDVTMYRLVNEKGENIFPNAPSPLFNDKTLKRRLTEKINSAMEKKRVFGYSFNTSSKKIFLVSHRGLEKDITEEVLSKILKSEGTIKTRKNKSWFNEPQERKISNIPQCFLDIRNRYPEKFI